jgi:hypothetical protein
MKHVVTRALSIAVLSVGLVAGVSLSAGAATSASPKNPYTTCLTNYSNYSDALTCINRVFEGAIKAATDNYNAAMNAAQDPSDQYAAITQFSDDVTAAVSARQKAIRALESQLPVATTTTTFVVPTTLVVPSSLAHS